MATTCPHNLILLKIYSAVIQFDCKGKNVTFCASVNCSEENLGKYLDLVPVTQLTKCSNQY